MITIVRKAARQNETVTGKKKAAQTKKKTSPGFKKAWGFWKTVQIDLSQFKFDREEANAR